MNEDNSGQESDELMSFGIEEFAQAMTRASKEKQAEPAEEEAQAETEGEEAKESEDKAKAESEEDTVLSQINLDDLDEEQLNQILEYSVEKMSDEKKAEWAEKIGSGAGKAAAKLRKQYAQLKEQMEGLKKSSQQIIPNDNPFKQINSDDDLKAEEEKLQDYINTYDKILRNNSFERNENDEEGLWIKQGKDEKWFSRSQIFDVYSSWQKDLRRLPERRMQLREEQQNKEKAKKALDKVKENFEWYDDEDSEEYQLFNKLNSDPDIQMAMALNSALAAKLPEVFAYYVQGKSVKKSKPKSELFLKAKDQKKAEPPMRKVSSNGAPDSRGKGPDGKSSNFEKALWNGDLSYHQILNMR